MILMIDAANRAAHAADLQSMFEHRKSVFVDQLGWNLRPHDGEERDCFDASHTLYLLAKRDAQGPILASARLLPTEQPHLMSEVFCAACPAGVPRGPDIWEASRFCPSPYVADRRERLRLLWLIITGIMESALLLGKEHVTFTANRALLPLTMRCAWHTTLLGPSVADGADAITPVLARITPAALAEQRQRFALPRPLIRYSSGMVEAA